jgi:chromosomal replication initiator protein
MTTTNTYWNCVQEDLKLKISLSQYQAWLSRVNFVKTTNLGKSAILEVPSKFNLERIEKKYKQDLLNSMNKYYPNVSQIEFVIKKLDPDEVEFVDALITSKTPINKPNDDANQENQPQHDGILESRAISDENKRPTTKSSKKFQNGSQEIFDSSSNSDTTLAVDKAKTYSVLPKQNIHNLNARFTFESLVSAGYNELAVSVAKAIVRQPGKLYNPVFIHSSTGLGKTHLLQAIGHKVLEMYPSFNIRYTTAETILNHYTACMQKGRGNEFHEYYRSVDLLMIDDIQFFTNKISTQEVLFHTFNELHQQNKQIIITSDRSPKSLNGFQDRLISRFEWGMVLDLSQPSMEDRIAIIKQKITEINIKLSDEQIIHIAQNVQTNIRDLEGVLNQIQARVAFQPNLSIDDDFLNKILQPYLGVVNQGLMQFSYNSNASQYEPEPLASTLTKAQKAQFARTNTYSGTQSQLSIPNTQPNLKGLRYDYNKVFEAIALKMRISKEEIISKKRDKTTAIARQIMMYILYQKYGLSTTKIGQIVGNRKHTTALHAINKVKQVIAGDNNFKLLVSSILMNA